MSIARRLHRWLRPQRGERLQAAVVYTLVALLVGAAVLLTGVRLLFAAAPSLTAPVERMVAAELGVPVAIGGLDARLEGLRPGLVLRDVRVGDAADGEALVLDAMTLAVAPWASLRSGQLQLHALAARGLDVTLRGEPGADWQVSGLLPGAGGATLPGFLAALQGLPVDRLLIRDSRLVLVNDKAAARLALAPVALRWRRETDGEWRFALDARDGDERIEGRLQLTPGAPARARGFIEFDGLAAERLSAWAPGLRARPAAGGSIAGRIWLALAEPGRIALTTELDGRGLGLFDGAVDSLQGLARFERIDGAWRGRVETTALGLANGRTLSPGPASLARSADGLWRLAMTRLPLAPLAALLPRDGVEWPRVEGRLRRLALVWRDPADWRLRGELAAAGLDGAPPWPLLEHADASLTIGPRGGAVDVRGLQADTQFGELLRNPARLTAIQGGLRWWRDGAGGWRLALDDWRGDWEGTALSLNGRVWLAAGRPAFVDLSAAAGAAEARRVMRHLPVGVMDERLLGWLDEAVGPGRMTGASLRLFGPLEDFPFDGGSGLFDLRSRLAPLAFRFRPDWPGFEAVDAELRFRNRGMTVSADSARIAGVSLRDATASVADLWTPRLRIDGSFRGALQAMQDFLVRSPLLADSSALQALSWQGDGDLDLALYFPFQQQPLQVDGRLQLDGARLASAAMPLALDDIRGALRFDEQGVAWDGLRARFAGRPVISRASTRGEGRDARIEVIADARLGVEDWPGLGGLADRATGVSAWRLRWQRPGFAVSSGLQVPQRLTLRSALEGVALDLPLALGKAAGTRAPLALDWSGQADGGSSWRLAYDERLELRMATSGTGERRAALHFGAGSPALPAAPITRLTGRLPRLDLAAAGTGPMGTEGAAALTDALPPLDSVDITLAAVDLRRWRLGETRLKGGRRAAGWAFDLSGAAQGSLLRESATAPWLVRLDRLSLATRATGAAGAAAGDARGEADQPPAERAGPDIDLVAERLLADGTPLGRAEFTRTAAGTAAARARFDLEGESVDLEATLERPAADAGAYQLAFDLYTRDAGEMLRALGMAGVMDAGEGSISGRLDWLGTMFSPRLPTLAGELGIDLRKGGLPAVEPGAGRALGLFSLSVLPRRLGLDFSDVVGEGLRFDQMEGTWRIRAGQMQTDGLTVTGPSLNLMLRGRTDLVRQRYDQTVTVTPRLGSALTFLGGLAGGPAAAVMLFFTRGMIEPGVERLTEFTYRIEGPWADPRFELIDPVVANGADGEADGR